MPSDEALFNAGISPTSATELFDRRQAECGISQCTYILEEYDLTRLSKIKVKGCDMSKCYAVQHSDQMVCERCHQSWDVNDRCEPECKPEAERTKEVQFPSNK